MNSVAATAPTHAKPATDRCRMLSILLPVRNEGINLRIMLKILRAVVDLPHEVLVVYDSAGDDSVAVVNDVRQIYPELRGIQNTLGHGVVNAIRAGVGASEGDVILIFAADEVGPDHVAQGVHVAPVLLPDEEQRATAGPFPPDHDVGTQRDLVEVERRYAESGGTEEFNSRPDHADAIGVTGRCVCG